jgi:hypothetical protein
MQQIKKIEQEKSEGKNLNEKIYSDLHNYGEAIIDYVNGNFIIEGNNDYGNIGI